MRPVVWSRRARHDLGILLDYIRARSPSGAAMLLKRIQTSIETLPAYPYVHREGREPGTREAVVHANYICVYAVRPDRIEILRVLHARQRYP